VNPEEAEIVGETFDIFLWEETDAGTRRKLKTGYGDDVLKGHRVKTLLTEHAYIGKPQVPDDVAEGYAGPSRPRNPTPTIR